MINLKISTKKQPEYIAVKEKDLNKFYASLIITVVLVIFISTTVFIKMFIIGMELTRKNGELNKVVEMQKSIISDMQEDNMKLQEMIK